jgi:hypothetical protein
LGSRWRSSRLATPTYQAIGFITDESDFTVARAAEKWRALRGVPNLRVKVASAREALASFGEWELRLMVDEGGYVPAEVQAIAAECPSYRNAAAVARCKRMLSVTSYDADPDMDYFNDYLLAVEAIVDGFRGVYAQDSASGDWFDEGRA